MQPFVFVHTRPYIGYWHLIHVQNSVCFSFVASDGFSHCFLVSQLQWSRLQARWMNLRQIFVKLEWRPGEVIWQKNRLTILILRNFLFYKGKTSFDAQLKNALGWIYYEYLVSWFWISGRDWLQNCNTITIKTLHPGARWGSNGGLQCHCTKQRKGNI